MKKQDCWYKDATLIIALIFLCVLCSCATSHQVANYPVLGPDGKVIGFGMAESKVIAVGNAKTLIDKVRASSGKTASVGIVGTDLQSEASQTIAALTELLRAVRPPVIPIP